MLLAIETATDVCSTALLDEGAVVAVAEVLRARSHAGTLAVLIEGLLAREGIRARDLDVVAVSAGPGSYTGLRIGVSTAKGLCFASGAALVGVPSLEALAASVADVPAQGDLILTAVPSRRREVYAAAFRREQHALAPVAEAAALTVDRIAGWLPRTPRPCWIVGEAGPEIADLVGPNHRLLDPSLHRASAVTVARLGWRRWQAGTAEDLAAFEPLYLKPFEVRRQPAPFDRPSP